MTRATGRKPTGRPITWPSKVSAPPEALALYRMIAKLQNSEAFKTCHIYNGAKIAGMPVIRFEGKVTSLPFVVASFMGMPYAERLCESDSCINPFHYTPNIAEMERLISGVERKPDAWSSAPPPATNYLDDWLELIEYETDRARLRREDWSFEAIRPLIHVDDMTDHDLHLVMRHLKIEA